MTRLGITLAALFFVSACGSSDTGGGRTTTGIGGDAGTGDGSGSGGGNITQDPDPFVPSGGAHKVVFVHHSTGQHIWAGGVEAAYMALRPDDKIQEQMYPTSAYAPWENKPQTYQHLWTDMPDSDGRTKAGQESFAELLAKGDVLVLKHCFDGDAMTPDDGGAFSQTLDRYKAAYEALKTLFKAHPDKIFIVWTVAPLSQSERAHYSSDTSERIQLSLQFRDWVLNKWDEQGDNIFVFDYRLLATRGTMNYIAESDTTDPNPDAHDSHPSDAISKEIAPCFARRVADVVNGDGDSASRTGGCSLD